MYLCTKPEIDQLNMLLLGDEYILQLDIPVDNILVVKIEESLAELLEQRLGLELSEPGCQ